MNLFSLPTAEDLKTPQFWLLGLAGCLVAIHFTLTDRAGQPDFLGLTILIWFAIASLIQRKSQSLQLNSDLGSTLVGTLLIAIVLMRSVNATTNPGLSFMPLVGGFGLALVASGFKGLGQYWREFILLGLLAIPQELGVGILNIAPTLSLIIAKIVGFTLWYLGFQVSIEGNQLFFPSGGIIVNDACAGVANLIYLFKVSIIFLILFPLSQRQTMVIVPLIALALAFIMNLFRVGLLAILSPHNPQAFEYWHEGTGSLAFTFTVVVIFGSFYLYLLRQEPHST
ncbi:MAG: cyanoexosortase A [Snowella sp.]|nr:cyanoexosortase A [Snowella sp.]